MPTSYPLDLTGNAGTNLITNELHTFNIAADRIFPLTAGPFYTIGLEVYHGVTNQLLQPITQYKALHLHRDASLVSGKEVCAVIIVEDALIPSVRVKYHCIGGLYSNEASLIQDLIDNNPITSDDVVWGQIIGIPVQFPPTEHLHHFDNIYGAEEMVAVLERIRMAIAAGDSPAIAAIYQYIHTLLTNLDYQTEQQVIDLIGDTNVQYVKTYDSYAQLRTETHVINNESYLYIATGKGARNDRKGRIFMWDITSMAVDDNDKALRPNHILETNPGRFIAMLDVELDLKNALATLGRRIEANGTVNADLGVVNRIESVSMNSLITPGDYWIHSNCTNRPDNTETLALKVWRESDTAIGQQAQCLYSTENYPHNRQGITYSRVSLDGGTTWPAWHETFTVARAVANGLDVDLATTNATNADLNTLVRTGKYWFGNTNAHRPEYNPGLYMEYAQLEVVCLNSTDVMQRAFNTSLEAYRHGYGGTAYAGHSWSPWEFRAARNGDTTQTFAMYSPDINAIDPSHGVNAAFLATQFATLWARLTANGIDATIGVTNVLPAYTDLDGVITVGKYWVGHSSGYNNSPFDYGILEVEKIDANNIIQTMYDELRRTSRRTDSAGTWWTEWTFSQNLNIAYESSRDSRDLDWTLTPGEYYYTPNTINRPTPYGLLKVWRVNSDIVYQQAQGSDNTLHTRYRDGLGVWTAWSTPLTQSTLQSTVIIHPKPSTYTVPVGGYTDVVLKPYGTLKVWMVSGGGGGASAESIFEAVGTDETQQPGGQSGVWLMLGIVPFLIAVCTGGGIGTAPRSDYEESPSMAGGANGANGTYVTTSYGTIDVLEAGVAPIPSTMIGNKFPFTFAGPLGVGTAPLSPFDNFQGGGGGGNGSYASIIVKNDSTTDAVTLRLYSGAGGINDNERGGYANNGRLEYAIA